MNEYYLINYVLSLDNFKCIQKSLVVIKYNLLLVECII